MILLTLNKRTQSRRGSCQQEEFNSNRIEVEEISIFDRCVLLTVFCCLKSLLKEEGG